jgi:type I restriction enzyme S subunit
VPAGGASGELPAGWARATLAELGVEAQPGFASGKHNRDGDGIVHLRPMNITRNGVIDLSDARYVDDDSDRRVEYGDVLFNNTNSPALVGKTAWVGSLESAAYSNHMTRLRGPKGLDSKFLAIQLHWLWASGYFKNILNNHVNQASVARAALLATEIVVPPLPEQLRIVTEVEQQIARIEAGESSVHAASMLQESLRSSILDHYALGLFGDPSDSSLDRLSGRQGKKIDYRSLRALPGGWSWRVAEDVCELITSGSTPHASLMYPDSGEIPFLKVYNISRRGFIDFTVRPTFIAKETHEGKLKRSKVRPGDVLTNIVGPPLGKTAVVPHEYSAWNINQAIVAFRAGPEISPDWLRYVLQSPYVIGVLTRTARATAGQFNIALSTCRELPIPVPPRGTQEELCQELAKRLADIEALCSNVGSMTSQSVDLRASLLHAAFTGALVPQDPADEPASALLDRIRAEQKAKAPRKRAARKPRSAPPGQEELPS